MSATRYTLHDLISQVEDVAIKQAAVDAVHGEAVARAEAAEQAARSARTGEVGTSDE